MGSASSPLKYPPAPSAKLRAAVKDYVLCVLLRGELNLLSVSGSHITLDAGGTAEGGEISLSAAVIDIAVSCGCALDKSHSGKNGKCGNCKLVHGVAPID